MAICLLRAPLRRAALVPRRARQASAAYRPCRSLIGLPSIPEPPLPSLLDAELDRSGRVSESIDPFSSRKLQGKGGSFRGRDVVPMWIADMDFRAPQVNSAHA